MTIQSVLCIFEGNPSELSGLNAAFALAKAHHAHLRILHLSYDPVRYIALCGEAAMINAAMLDAFDKENRQQREKAREYAAEIAERHRMTLADEGKAAFPADAEFLSRTGYPEVTIGKEGRISDMIVAGCGAADPNALYDSILISAAVNTGRPVLFMPACRGTMPENWKRKVISLAWNGSVESARAIRDALPLLRRAEKVHVLLAREHKDVYDLDSAEGMLAYLRAHGLNPDAAVIDCGEQETGRALLEKAKELRSDLLVIGLYGHTRFREMLLGGVSNFMLANANMPLLLSH